MKSLSRFLFIFVFSIGISFQIKAQVKTKAFYKGIPSEMIMNQDSITNEINIPAPENFSDLLKKGNAQNDISNEYLYKFALPVKVDIDILKEAKVFQSDNFSTYAIRINAQNALNISLSFSEFVLSKNSILSIYTSNELTDSITAKENTSNRIWESRVYQGSKVTILLKVPVNEKVKPILKIGKVNFGFKKFGGEYFGSPGASGACNINVLCPEGNGWQNERNSVALIVVNGIAACTGALIMNTCNTNIPYFLTANHCVIEGGPVTNWVFQFQYWSATCTPNSGWHEDIQFNGSTLKASNAESDFALLLLNQRPPANSGIQYAGWSRGNPGFAATCIHHPRGDLMKISSKDFNLNVPITAVQWMGSPNLSHWRVIFNHGIVQGGSSGAPLFDQNHRIIGQLHGYQNNVCDNTDNNCFCNTIIPAFGVVDGAIGEFGRFDLSWTGGGTNITRLSNWLDPTNSGAATTNTTNIASLVPPAGVLSLSGSEGVCSGTSQYTLKNDGIPATGNITWVSSNPNIATVTPTSNPATVTKMGNGNVIITATLSGCDAIKSISKSIVTSVPDNSAFNIYQDPTCNDSRINFGAYSGSTFDNCSLWNMGVTNITWDIIYGNSYQVTNNIGPGVCANGLNNSGIQVYFSNTYIYNVPYIRFKAQNACGWSDWMLRPKPVSFQACGSWSFSATPNPASSSLNVALNEDEQAIKTGNSMTIQEIQITDKLGKVVKQFKYSTKVSEITLDISSLKQDVYFVRVYNGNEWKTESISKQ